MSWSQQARGREWREERAAGRRENACRGLRQAVAGHSSGSVRSSAGAQTKDDGENGGDEAGGTVKV